MPARQDRARGRRAGYRRRWVAVRTGLSGAPLTGPTALHRERRSGSATSSSRSRMPSSAGSSPSPAPVAASAAQPGPGETIVVPVDATLLGLRSPAPPASGVDGGLRPRVKSGWALKRLGEEEGESDTYFATCAAAVLRMEAEDAALFELLDGERSVIELLGESERLVGPGGPGRLARLIADLADRGLLEGVGGLTTADRPRRRSRSCSSPRRRPSHGWRTTSPRASPLGPDLLLSADGHVPDPAWPGRVRGVRIHRRARYGHLSWLPTDS